MNIIINIYTSTDTKSFLFNLESHGRMKSMMKFNIKNTGRGYFLNDKSHEFLISIGNINICKENNKNLSGCEQIEETYDYQGISNAICGRTRYKENGEIKGECFIPLRITVIQMEMTEEQKHNEEHQRKQIEEWTGLKYGEILFDSDKDNWSKETSVFDDKIKGKKRLLFMIEDNYCEKFGYYLNTNVNNEYNNKYLYIDRYKILFI